jgi:UDP-N-acetylglucosamine 3-dehydrogenase
MNTTKIRIAQIGIKNHGRTILQATKEAGNLELISVFDTDTAAAKIAAGEFDARTAERYEEILNDSRVDAVSLVTPNHLHADEVQQAAEAGKHVFVEKPMSLTVSEGRVMIGAMKKAGRVLMVGHNTRRRRVFRRAKQLLLEKRIGDVVSVEMNISRPAGLQPGLPDWKGDPEKCPLLPMTQLGIHFIDTLEYLLGSIQRVSCFAASRAMPGGILDSSCALLQLSSGIPATLSSSYVTPDVYFIQIYGTEGILRCNSLSLRLELSRNGEISEVIEESFEDEGAESCVLEMREFGSCIVSGKQPETGGKEGLRAVAVIEAMLKSLRTQSVTQISEVL